MSKHLFVDNIKYESQPKNSLVLKKFLFAYLISY